jgi:hypothetical protein
MCLVVSKGVCEHELTGGTWYENVKNCAGARADVINGTVAVTVEPRSMSKAVIYSMWAIFGLFILGVIISMGVIIYLNSKNKAGLSENAPLSLSHTSTP